ncbi:unnamed protein product [Rotaria sp. Silwood1]|nr:unnamed protein product [Rotaria sp. Silwood1]
MQITWTVIVAILCVLMVIGAVALVLILSLIPTYLPTKSITSINNGEFALSVTYGTNLASLTSARIADTSQLAQQKLLLLHRLQQQQQQQQPPRQQLPVSNRPNS